ncbi:uncharacterized protein LOC116805288 [Drosophila grimshawi]|uniref:uncharacterized protein LOC116805288 n=1 Tax=Drosophila grimshawi TaxID=7222 RepID=UPI001C936D61|nr:uncharacterized protein LOC116805288 [Drosophila grimshawi]
MTKRELLSSFSVACLIILATLDSNPDAVPTQQAAVKTEQTSVTEGISKSVLNVLQQRHQLYPQQQQVSNLKPIQIKEESKETKIDKKRAELNEKNKAVAISLSPPIHFRARHFRNDLRLQTVPNYIPDKTNLETVCVGRSTVYNIPRVIRYLKPEIIGNTKRLTVPNFISSRNIYMDLRQELYNRGRSEECHVKKNIQWRDYLECALRRNQRMEYLIPKYPLHQVHYFDQTALVPEY